MANNKILYLLPRNNFFSQLGGVGGHVTHCKGVVEGFLKQKYDVTLVTGKETSAVPFEVSSRLSIVELNFSLYAIFRYLYFIRKLINKENPKFVYTRFSVKAFYVPFLIKIISPKTKILLEVNSIGQSSFDILKYFDLIALKCSDIIVVISKQLSDQVVAIDECLSDKIIVLQNGVNAKRFDCPAVQDNIKGINIGYAGTLKPNYGIEHSIHAAINLAEEGYDISFNIAGTGPEKDALMKLAERNSQINFLGRVDFENIPKFYSQQDILLYTTSKENIFQSPIKLYEYMAAGKAIIAMSTPTTESLIENRVTGILIPLGNTKEIAKQLKILVGSRAFREKLGNNAKIHVRKHDWSERLKNLIITLKNRGWDI
jgi:glycosyltransferase involved in cell wall biosynthesis